MNLQVQSWFQMFLLQQTEMLRHYKSWISIQSFVRRILHCRNKIVSSIPLSIVLNNMNIQPATNVQTTIQPITPTTIVTAEDNNIDIQA
ncbi:hypothetical protein Tco_1319807 [Tanacetum coccineum]